MEKTSLIIVCYNSYSVIERCLSPLIDSGLFPVYIVDNASVDDSAEKLRSRFPGASFLIQESNLGYGRAANVALGQVQTPYALLLNPDILMTVEQVTSLTQKTLPFMDAILSVPATSVKHQEFGVDPLAQDKVSGSCMLFHMENLRKVGFFDENIFLFSEETDLCMRILNEGFKIVMFPDIYVKHLAGESSGHSDAVEYMKEWHFGWSRSYYYHKHGLDQGRRALWRRLFIYCWKSKTSLFCRKKRIKYSAISAGIRAFNDGMVAFHANGTPQANPHAANNPFRI